MDDWAGIPMPLSGTQLVIEPKYPHARALMNYVPEGGEAVHTCSVDDVDEHISIKNIFFSTALQREVAIYEKAGKLKCVKRSPVRGRLNMLIETLGASYAWGLEEENNALRTLRRLVKPHIYKMYRLTGQFPETSERSAVTYIFRRLRPTIALGRQVDKNKSKILACLCLHPIGFYNGSWAGAMCPTDDVIAHLLMMRGDEHMFWRRATQHQPWEPEAGL